MPTCANLLERFTMITTVELIKIVSVINKPRVRMLLMSHLPTIIDTNMHIISLYLSTSVFPSSCKLIEKVISSRILKYIADNDLIDKFLQIGVVTVRKQLC